MKLVCTQSRLKDFTVGEVYHDTVINYPWGGQDRLVDGNRIGGWALNGGGLEVRGDDYSEPYATFKEVKNKKTLPKMIVRAYVNHAKSRGWGDSKNGAYRSWNQTPYNSTKDWARNMAAGFCIKTLEESAEMDGEKICQKYINDYIDDDMSYY